MDSIGRYQVVRQLGHGGMGDVYLARDPSLERKVALKLLHLESAQTGLRGEAKALASLNHPGIVTIYEIGSHNGQDFIAMEYLPGRSLRELLNEADVHPRRTEMIAICAQVTGAVGAAHRAGILHRDIKPENVVVDDGGHVKVVDFGIARRLDHDARRQTGPVTAQDVVDAFRRTIPPELAETQLVISAGTQTVFGTPAYMAPEVLLGAQSTKASDVYSLGILFYECLAGRRPYDAGSMLEVMAQMIEQPPPPLVDPLAGLVAEMLASDPAKRPTPDEVMTRLTAPVAPVVITMTGRSPRVRAASRPAAPPPQRWPLIAGVALTMVAIGVAAWQVARRTASTPEPVVAAAPVIETIAVAPIKLDIPDYGAESPVADVEADTIARMFEEVHGAHFTGVALRAGDDPKATRASYLVTGSVKGGGGQLHGDFTLARTATGAVVAEAHIAVPETAHGKLVDQVVTELSHGIAPAATLDLTPNRQRAAKFYREGEAVFMTGRFTDARAYLEQTVDADPTYFDGWYALALVVSWMNAPEDVLLDVTQHGIAIAPPGPKKDLMRGVALFIAEDYAAARAVLEPLDTPTDLSTVEARTDRTQILYYLGETNWHDGHHDVGFKYLKRALDLDPRFRPATVHAMQYTIVRRDVEQARYFNGLAGEPSDALEFALGNYEQLAASGSPGIKLQAQLVLERPLTPDVAPRLAAKDLDGATLRIAQAAATGDADGARREFAAIWRDVLALRDTKHLTQGTFYGLEALAEVVICAGMIDETKQIIALLADQSRGRPMRGYHRLSILAAPLVGDQALVVTAGLSFRDQQLADASTAELAGDRAKAVRVLTAMVGDPSAIWDYVERAALIRNLAALHRASELEAVCDDTLHPAAFRPAFLVVRASCKRPK